jgi:hypothetical protein
VQRNKIDHLMAEMGHSRPGWRSSTSSNVRYAPKSGNKIGSRCCTTHHDELSPMTVATAANRSAKYLILLVGGPGRTRTSNQAVMSALPCPKKSVIIGNFANVR